MHHGDLHDWERSAGGPDPALLSRLDGRVHKIRRPQSGEIEFGLACAFFTPIAAQMVADRHTNAHVSFLLGFSYDGPQAWSVRLLNGGGRRGSDHEAEPQVEGRQSSDEVDPSGSAEEAS